MAQGRPTLADIAVLADVSIATASKVVNGRSDVAPATRTRVMQVLEDSGYTSPVARKGRNGYRSGVPTFEPGHRPQIVVMVPGMETMYSATVFHGIIAGGLALGVDVVARMGANAHDSTPVDAGTDLPSDCVGVIAITHAADGLRIPDASARFPVVAIDPWQDAPAHWMTIGATNWMGSKSATDHLLTLGHRSIGWIGGPAGNEASAERLHGYRAALQSVGIGVVSSRERDGEFEFEFGRRAAVELLGLRDRPTALVAANDEIAIGAIDGALSMGLSVPGDLSVTGFDDTPQASWSTPKLTSVRQPLADMGRMAVSMILDTVRGSVPETRHVQLGTTLMVRESTAPPRNS